MYFIEPVSKQLHLKTLLCSRFANFFKNIDKSDNVTVRVLVNLCLKDNNSVLCRNINFISTNCDLPINELSKELVKKKMTFSDIPVNEEWKIEVLNELLNTRHDFMIQEFDKTEIDFMIYFICTS